MKESMSIKENTKVATLSSAINNLDLVKYRLLRLRDDIAGIAAQEQTVAPPQTNAPLIVILDSGPELINAHIKEVSSILEDIHSQLF